MYGKLALLAHQMGKDNPDNDSIYVCLVSLLGHKMPMVREGAILGLSEMSFPSKYDVFKSVAESDSSPGVKELALELLEDL